MTNPTLRMAAPHAAGYCRLSREDEHAPGSTAAKWEARRQIVRDLAARHGLELAEADIHIERASGSSLAARPVLLALLDDARHRRITHLLTPYQDRLSRGSRLDEQAIEDALVRGRVVLITTETVTDYGAEDYDYVSDLRGAIGRIELELYRRRRRETNKAKAGQGQRYCGYAPYGYRWVLPTPAQPGHYESVPQEYEVLCELFRRARAGESGYALLRELNERLATTGAPLPPGHGRRKDAGPRWSRSTLYRLLANPFYAGYPTQRERVIRGERRRLDTAEWVAPAQEQPYPHPLTLAEHEALRAQLSGRRLPGVPKQTGEALLSGLLHCPEGRPMSGGPRQYHCQCRTDATSHPGQYLSRGAVEALVADACRQALEVLPAQLSPRPTISDRTELERQWKAARQTERDAETVVDEQQRNLGVYVRAWGEDGYITAAQRARSELEAARARLEDLRAALVQPDWGEALSLIAGIRQVGWEAYWEEATPRERRATVRLLVRRVQMAPSPGRRRHADRVKVEMVPAVDAFWPSRWIWLARYRPPRSGSSDE